MDAGSSISQLGFTERTSRLWDWYALIYDRLWDNRLTAATAHLVLDAVQCTGATSVLEVGAGTGLISQALVSAGLEVLAYEPSGPMRDAFMSRLPETRCRSQALGDIHADGTKRTVVASNVLHLLDDPAAGLQRLIDLAGPNGTIVAVTPDPSGSLRSAVHDLRGAGESPLFIGRFLLLSAYVAARTSPIDQPDHRRAASAALQKVGERISSRFSTFEAYVVTNEASTQASNPSVQDHHRTTPESAP